MVFAYPARRVAWLVILWMACPAWAAGAWAETPAGQDISGNAPAARQNPTPGAGITDTGSSSTAGFFSSSRATLLGDMGHVRPALGRYGISLGLQETDEVFGNVTGGIHRGADYDGLTLMGVGIDTDRAFGLPGGTLNISAFQIHGRDLSADNLRSLQTNSSNEATRATRLWEAWYQQAFFNGRFDIKIGQQSLDQEFMTSAYSGLFINTMMGWPLIPSVDLYAGGPAYPLSSLGIRLRGQPVGNITLLGGVFDDNPPGGAFNDDSQVRGAEQSGTRFSLNTGALFIGEIQYALNAPETGNADRTPHGLPGTYKLGFWYDTGSFPDQRLNDTRLSLANALSIGDPRMLRGNFSIYGIVDQTIWQPENRDDPRSIGIFARIMGAPGDRNMADFSINAGITFKAPLPGRSDDTVGLGYGLAKLSNRLAELERETAALNGTFSPIQSNENFLELTYQAQIAPWLQVQPDFQYVFMPSGGIENPNRPGKRISNEAIFGLRTNIIF